MTGIISIILSVIVTLVLFGASRLGNPQEVSFWLLLAKLSGLIGSVLIAWSFIIAIKNSLIEKMFDGLDKAYKIHNIIGNIAFIVIVNHPVFLMINSLPFNTTKVYLIPSFDNLSYAFGILALYTLILLIALTIFVDLPYKFWKKTHEYIGIVIVLSSLHGLLITSDVTSYLPLMLWILGINILAIIAFLYKRYFYYFVNKDNNYVLKNISKDGDYVLLTLIPQNPDKSIIFKPGQFAFFALEDDIRDDHPFSVVDQSNGQISFGTKTVGNFTTRLANLPLESKINIIGPFGSFASNLSRVSSMVWISGGIGITPFVSMAKSLLDNQNVTMIHTARSSEPKLFLNLISEIVKNFPNFKLIIHYSDKLGHLDNSVISKYASFNSATYVYLCGPKQMMEDLSDKLPDLGIKQKRIIYEDFSLKP